MNNKILFFVLFIWTIFAHIPAQSQTTVQGNFTFEGIERSYLLYVPASYSAQSAAPLLLNLHGYGSNMNEQMQYGEFRPIADTAGFLLVVPNGTPDFNNTMHWNTFGTSNVNDVGFLSALMDTISMHYNVDPHRLYSTGMSNGGFMSYSLACFLNNRMAAIASVTGTMTTANFMSCIPTRPVPVMQIHGTADGTVPYNGNAFFLSVPTILTHWIDVNNCNATPEVTLLPDVNTADGCTAEHYLYSGGDAGSTVEHYKIIGGGHSWPGAPLNINVTNMDFNASAVIWQFLRKYNLSGLLSISDEFAEVGVVVGPNPAQGTLTIRSEKESLSEVKVFDAQGRLLQHIKAGTNDLQLDLKQKGFLFIQVSTKTGSKVFKVVNA